MTISPAFGRLLTTNAVSSAVEAHLKLWIIPFLAEVERQIAVAPRTVAAPKSWETVSVFGKFDASALPSVVIAVDEISGEPTRYGDGSYEATFPVAVAVVVGGRTPKDVQRNSMAYGAAVRGAMLHAFDPVGALGAVGMKWVGESYTEIDASDRRTKGAAMVLFDVRVENVARDYVGRSLGTTPPADPYLAPDALATVQSVITTVEQLP